MDLITDQVANGLMTGAVYALIASGLSVMFKTLDTVNFAHGEFYVLGGVVTYQIVTVVGLSPWIGLIAATVSVGLAGALLHLTVAKVLRINPLSVLLATFAVSLAVANLVDFGFKGNSGAVPPMVDGVFLLGPIAITNQRLLAAAAAIIAITILAVWLRRSRMGRSIRAVADNRVGAEILGIRTVRIDRWTFIISGAGAGLAGSVLAPVTQVTAQAGLPITVTAFVVLIIGGVGSVPGALVGGLLLGAIQGLTSGILGAQWSQLVSYIMLILALFLRPGLERIRGFRLGKLRGVA